MFHRTPARALALCLVAAPLAAQPLPEALQAATPATPNPDPARPTVAMAAPVAAPADPANIEAARQRWRQANDDVGAFPRGHIDLLRWEARRTAEPARPGAGPGTAPPLTLREALERSLRARPDLVLAPGAGELEAAAQQRALAQHNLDLRSAWLAAVAAREALGHARELAHAADTAAELGQRMVQAGNWSRARLLREQLAQAQQQAAMLEAQAEAERSADALLRAMAVWRASDRAQLGVRIPSTLPALPARPQPTAEGEALALQARADVQTRRANAERSARALTERSRQDWDSALDAALKTLPADALPTQPLRLSDPRPQRQHGMQAALVQEAGLLQAAVTLRSQAREAARELLHRHAVAEHAQNVLLPLQTALEQETLLRYNGMLQSTWELIEAAQARMRAAAAASAARHAFWQAQLNHDALLAGADPQPLGTSTASPAPTSAAAAH